jgi:hypothetical protein
MNISRRQMIGTAGATMIVRPAIAAPLQVENTVMTGLLQAGGWSETADDDGVWNAFLNHS